MYPEKVSHSAAATVMEMVVPQKVYEGYSRGIMQILSKDDLCMGNRRGL